MPLDMISGFFGADAGAAQGYQIPRSLRFNSADTAYLNRTPGVAGNRTKNTTSFWCKLGKLGTSRRIFSTNGANNDNDTAEIVFASDDTLSVSGWSSNFRKTNRVFRDPAAWYHIVVAIDTANGTTANKIRIYVNGLEETSFASSTAPSGNMGFAAATAHRIGIPVYASSEYWDGYLAEIHFVDGQQLTPSDFGQFDSTTGQWVPKQVIGMSYGTTGYYLPFSDNSGTTSTTLGKDGAGSNNWTPNNFSVTAGAGNDSLTDTPTNNHCVLNKLNSAIPGDGNLAHVATTNNTGSLGSIPILPGEQKYFEFTVTAIGASHEVHVGVNIEAPQLAGGTARGGSPTSYSVAQDGTFSNGSTSYNGSGTTFAVNDVIGIAVDRSANQLVAYKNGVSLRTITGLPSTGSLFPWVGTGGGTSSTGGYANFGQRTLGMAAPAGHTTLCNSNLPDPANRKPSAQFDVDLYTSNGSARTKTGLGFQPDLVWIKGRSGATDHAIYDSVRGTTKDIGSNLSTAETTQAQGVTAFNADGYSIGTLAKINTNAATYAAWLWKKGVTPGFDIVSGTTTSTSGTISMAHALGVAPAFVIVKNRSIADGFYVYHRSLGSSNYMALSGTGASAAGFGWAHTSSNIVLNQGSIGSAGGQNVVGYAFAEVVGFSRFASYTGNALADGPFVNCGFRPKWVLIKRASTGGNNWRVLDASRSLINVATAKENLYPNTSQVEDTTDGIVDFLSNGFKIRENLAAINATGETFIFAAFAEFPFKFANAR